MLITQIRESTILEEDLTQFLEASVFMVRLYGDRAGEVIIYAGDVAFQPEKLTTKQLSGILRKLKSLGCTITEPKYNFDAILRLPKEDYSLLSTETLLKKAKLYMLIGNPLKEWYSLVK